MDSGLAASRRPGMTLCLGRRIHDIDRIDDVLAIDDIILVEWNVVDRSPQSP
jgi:hypothetical protein